jgi:hypothetical protein
MRKESRFWRPKVRGWAASMLLASGSAMLGLSPALAVENYFVVDNNQPPAVDFAPSASDVYAPPPAAAYGQYAPAAPAYYGPGPAEAAVADEPWRLFQSWNNNSRWQITGFANGGVTGNARPAPSGFNGPLSFNDQHEGQFNQLYMQVERAIDTSINTWDVGGRVDMMYGSDYIFNQTLGFELDPDGGNRWNSNPYYGLVMPQLYGEVGYNDLSVKMGRFYTIIGYEVVPATGNFFYSHAYSHQYGEPFYHYGALATWRYSDTTSLLGGVVNGWDALDRTQDNAAFIGGLLWDGGDGRSLAITGIGSNEPTGEDGTVYDEYAGRGMYSVVFSQDFAERWTYVFQHDYGFQRYGSAYKTAASHHAEWYGINQYLFYSINDCWKAGTRFEWFRDDDGFRVAGVRPGNPTNGAYAGNFWAMTYGLNWTPTTNLTVRPELRYDWYDSGNFATPLPYRDETDSYMFTFATDLIWVW